MPSSQHTVGFDRDTRERNNFREWDEPQGLDDCRSVSSQKSDLGYHSSGATSDNNYPPPAAASSSHDHGCHHSMSSVRSVGSTGSHGSSRGVGPLLASHLVNGETRFPTAASYASDAQRSDAATVCSGSACEDIEVESVISADLNAQPSANPASPPSSVKMTVRISAAAANNNINNNARSINPLQAAVEAAVSTIESVLPQKGSRHSAAAAASLQHQHQLADHHFAAQNNMGPPLSRSLLLQQPQHHDNTSRAGSVRSFESNAGSDCVAQVDTDDCGGSLDMEVHSVQSQEDSQEEDAPAQNVNAVATAEEAATGDDVASKTPINPLLCCTDESNANGRTSPGGTIYKGRGNRRYQGRFMKLPLKRFHQNGVDLGDDRPQREREDENPAYYAAQPPPQQRNGGWPPARGRNPNGRHTSEGDRHGGRVRSRSRSRSRSREREHDRNHHVNHGPPPKYDRRSGLNSGARRWQDPGESGGPGGSSGGRGGGDTEGRNHRNGRRRPDGPNRKGQNGWNRNSRHHYS